MRRLILAVAAVAVLAGNVVARPAGNFGYGKPPTHDETQRLVRQHLKETLKDPSSIQDLEISKPAAGCFERGLGKRDVCGYKFCVAYNAKNGYGGYVGRSVHVYWKVQGYGLNTFANRGACPNSFENWDGSTSVELPRFCDRQPENKDCTEGREEVYEADAQEQRKVEAPAQDAASSASCSSEIRKRMLAKGMSESDVDKICGCSSTVIERMKASGMSSAAIKEVCSSE